MLSTSSKVAARFAEPLYKVPEAPLFFELRMQRIQVAHGRLARARFIRASPCQHRQVVGDGKRVAGIRIEITLPPGFPARYREAVLRAVDQCKATRNQAVDNCRSLYGEGTQAFGDFYQISNQQTLGKSEVELLAMLAAEDGPQVPDGHRERPVAGAEALVLAGVGLGTGAVPLGRPRRIA